MILRTGYLVTEEMFHRLRTWVVLAENIYSFPLTYISPLQTYVIHSHTQVHTFKNVFFFLIRCSGTRVKRAQRPKIDLNKTGQINTH